MHWAGATGMWAAGGLNDDATGGEMIPALILMGFGAAIGWLRAAKRGGTTADRLQYAAAHGMAAFLATLIAMTAAGHLGWLS